MKCHTNASDGFSLVIDLGAEEITLSHDQDGDYLQ
jgi:hypothetical protein